MCRDVTVAAAQIEVIELDGRHNKKRIISMLEAARNQDVDIVCFCEGSLTGWFVDAGKLAVLSALHSDIALAMGEIANACAKHDVNAIVGQVKPDGGGYWNEAVAITNKGGQRAIHSKRLLTPGEKQCNYHSSCPPISSSSMHGM